MTAAATLASNLLSLADFMPEEEEYTAAEVHEYAAELGFIAELRADAESPKSLREWRLRVEGIEAFEWVCGSDEPSIALQDMESLAPLIGTLRWVAGAACVAFKALQQAGLVQKRGART